VDGVDRLIERSRQLVDSASLAVFRICFGLIALWEVGRYFHHDWIHRYWEEPRFHFHYVGWGWVEPLPAPGMVVLWGFLGAAALGIAVGAFYRVATIVFATLDMLNLHKESTLSAFERLRRARSLRWLEPSIPTLRSSSDPAVTSFVTTVSHWFARAPQLSLSSPVERPHR
jgi:hypothetical protein